MRKSTAFLSLALIAVLSMGAVTTYNFYAPLVPGSNGQLLTSAGTNGNPTWLASGTKGQLLVSGGANAAPTWSTIKYAAAPLNSGFTGSISCHRHGPIVLLVFDGVTKTSNDVQLMTTIPSGYRPTSWQCVAAPDAMNGTGMWNLGPAGACYLYGAYLSGSTTKKYYGTAMFFTNDAMP